MEKLILPILSLPRQTTVTLVAQGQNIFHAVDALFGDLGDVNHALFARSELDECAELLDADNLAREDLSSLEVGGDDLDQLDGFCPSLPYRYRIRKRCRHL